MRRLVDGVVTKEAEFVFLAPNRWRVRHATGRELISVGPDAWELSADYDTAPAPELFAPSTEWLPGDRS